MSEEGNKFKNKFMSFSLTQNIFVTSRSLRSTLYHLWRYFSPLRNNPQEDMHSCQDLAVLSNLEKTSKNCNDSICFSFSKLVQLPQALQKPPKCINRCCLFFLYQLKTLRMFFKHGQKTKITKVYNTTFFSLFCQLIRARAPYSDWQETESRWSQERMLSSTTSERRNQLRTQFLSFQRLEKKTAATSVNLSSKNRTPGRLKH